MYNILKLVHIIIVLVFFSSCSQSEKRPNIIFIMSDDHAVKAISAYDSTLITTPNIDKIANEGVLFLNAFVTNSICSPSRATMLTGKYSHKNGLKDNRDEFDGGQQTFPKLLQKAGYQTFIMGKWHLKTEPTGFDKWKVLVDQGEYYKPIFREPGDVMKEYPGYTTDVITDFAIETMDKRKKDKPFCLLVHHKAPHRNWMPKVDHLDSLKGKVFELPSTFYDDYKTREETAGHADMRVEDMYISMDMKLQKEYYEEEIGTGGSTSFSREEIVKGWLNSYNRLTDEEKVVWNTHYVPKNEEYKRMVEAGESTLEWKFQRYIEDYLKTILSVDENVGRLLQYLDDNDLAENTIVVYTSDQGFYLGEHGWYDKRFMYDESFSTPLLIRYPNEIKAGTVADEMVLNLDFAETFLDYAGIDVPDDMQGESFRAISRGEKISEWRNSIYYHYYEYPHGWHKVRPHYGVRTDRFKLIHFYGEVDRWEFFDLEKDQFELNNQYQNSEYSKDIDRLKVELNRLQNKYEDSVHADSKI